MDSLEKSLDWLFVGGPKCLGMSGDPGRTRTCNPLIKSPSSDAAMKEDKPLRSAKRGKVRKKAQPRRNRN
jgi:hypothetical protein